MDDTPGTTDTAIPETHFVKADEVDQTGTDISPVPDDQLMEEVAEGLRQEQVSQTAPPATDELPAQEGSGAPPKRPELRRETSAPPPPMQPPPPAPVQQNTGKLPVSLAELRRLIQEMPRSEQPAYAFEYADSQPFVEEVEEWFQYSEYDRVLLMGMRSSFEHKWYVFCESQPLAWTEASDDARRSFMDQTLKNLRDDDLYARIEALEAVCYALTGVWGLTAGRSVPEYPEDLSPRTVEQTPKFKSLQIRWIENSVDLIQKCSGIGTLLEYMSRVFEKHINPESEGAGVEDNPAYLAAYEREANLVLTALYLIVEVGRRQEAQDPQHTPVRNALNESKPNVLVFLVEIIAGLRWDESANVPLTRIILLLWKTLLLIFGGSESLKQAKEDLEPDIEAKKNDPSRRMPFLTASPLDYHQFRQEITSKYPAYTPPPAVVPLELENNSILPPLPQHPSRVGSSNGLFSGVGPSMASGNGSILHQSVHIATPAPSPPPSPIGPGGKAGKKQNYQTNQNFPFMYPPLDNSSNNIGGKGTTEIQDTLVGKRWDGSDVPASIIEAGQLFSTHVKMTRAMRQLWEERERFMKYDRGWNLDDTEVPEDLDLSDELAENLDDLSLLEKEKRKPKHNWPSEKETDHEDIQRRLDAVESFYTHALVHLQSITIVFLKIILTNVNAMVGQNGQNGQTMSDGYGSVQGFPSHQDAFAEVAIDELDNIRLREITGKAISGSLVLMLKWFKRSHILKFEYMTQLLLDSNYMPLILKMFAHQDIDQAVAQKNDRDELGFFHFCRMHSDCPPETAGNSDDESGASDDEAIPPPIPRHRHDQAAEEPAVEEPIPGFAEGNVRPEVDELGYPTAPPPKEPITVFSFRNFFSAINYLHIMQKITRNKTHRCLLLVQYKSSTILRKGLKIPDPHLRFYTLKLFKSQVPYCGRKWRQSNMRVITAIYLYCRPELRDDWLAGSDVDAEVEEALPLEQALRGLTHWWHLRRYKDEMGGDEGATMMEEERDFFVRELEAMGWGLANDDLYVDETELTAPPMMSSNHEWDGGPMQMEGW